MEVPSSQFKAHCLQLVEEVRARRIEVIITRRGRPVAKLAPLADVRARPLLGYLRGTVTVTGDIVSPLGENWAAASGR